jgi:hypothetical protein
MKMNTRMREIAKNADLRDTILAIHQLPEFLQTVIERGWIKDPNGALLLAALDAVAHPAADRFTNLTFYEASVNHLHIPDTSSYMGAHDKQIRSVRVAYSFCYHLISKDKDVSSSGRDLIAVIAVGNGDNGTSARIYTKRSGESWIDNDLENYTYEAVMTIESADIAG